MHAIHRTLLIPITVFVAVCLWLAPTSTIAQNLWREAKIGMPLEAIREQFPGATPPLRPTKLRDGSQEALRLSGVSVEDHTFDAMFFFKNKKLVQINLELQEKGTAVFGLQTSRGIRSAFESKYGPPDDEQDYKGPTGPALLQLVSWRSGRTLITLSYATAAGKLQLLNIAYRLVPGGRKDDI
ncbi:hypothetical protein IEQ11_22600 [Lysobacter capsici]|uniref:hypothetical protein n=1 Tax=Lysobacter capsici TaxID=435897 RepID=UPI00177F126A|nr:hypothetical protein [Lysobacter capsici]UOF14475.1 hypothetical protein IEQ11_22600 [Lysobacter capsici]